MVTISFEVNELAIAYALQRKKCKDFGIDRVRWNRLFSGIVDRLDEPFLNRIRRNLRNEHMQAEDLKEDVEREWSRHERRVLAWLKDITRVSFKEPTVRVCIVPVAAGLTPFRDIAMMIVGKLRKGWGYPETIAHEIAHILFNQNFDFDPEIEHPYVQLIEEEIAVRLVQEWGILIMRYQPLQCGFIEPNRKRRHGKIICAISKITRIYLNLL